MIQNYLKDILDIANQFNTDKITHVKAHGNGNINDTYIASSSNGTRYILQRVNTNIFTSPQTVMSNMNLATTHIQECINSQTLKWKVQKIIQSLDNQNYFIHTDGSFWRMISFIEDSHSFDILDSHDKATELGKAVGLFHSLMSYIPSENLQYVLEGFHIVPQYLELYDTVRKDIGKIYSHEEQFAASFIKKHRDKATVLEEAKDQGILPMRVIHGDLKINNIMFCKRTDAAISIIDLDTIQPGLIHYDIGDCMRSSCNRLGEETREWKDVKFDTEVFKYIWRGYLSTSNNLMQEKEYEYIFNCIFSITFEIGLRFFTDYLDGDTYFKISYPENNLYRALVQFQLAQSILEQKDTITNIIDKEIA